MKLKMLVRKWLGIDEDLMLFADTLEIVTTNFNRRLNRMSAKFEELELQVAEMEDVVESAVALITGLVEKLKTVTTEAELQTVITELEEAKMKLADAVVANTPAE